MRNNSKLKYYFDACRPKHFIKNILVFAAPFFSFKYDLNTWLYTILAAFLFCFISSSIYIMNDIFDLEQDRLHFRKSKRPIAAGLITVKEAIFLSLILIVISFFFSYLLNPYLFLIISGYFLIQVLYCLYLKKEPILDVFCISSGFLLRAISGGVANNLIISPWFILSVTLLALFIAIEKRKAELRLYKKTGILTRKVLKRYSLSLLSRYESVVTTGCFFSYSLWASGPLLKGAPTSWMLFSVPLVLLGIFRYQLISDEIFNNRDVKLLSISTESPEEILLNDTGIKIIVIMWILIVLLISIFTL
tara:strand:+ start:32780 stop:33694 length:915 start_codon:yes stop_codon:yes gene_type:complete